MAKNKCFANSTEISQEWNESEVHVSRSTTLAIAGDELPQPSSRCQASSEQKTATELLPPVGQRLSGLECGTLI